ncbi:MAG TPA: helix-turn-helix domain-containing protein [Candidatus Butyricicoccus avicola]|nr:helix-turn-helix domain-containing protein [Candidatus Butyricicoccus avicola]
MSTVRMRFPAQALEELRKDDPATPVTLNMIRTLIRRGIIPSVKVGRGRLINYDELLHYLEHPTEIKPEQAHGIRRVDERAGA